MTRPEMAARAAALPPPKPVISIVIPVFNEERNVDLAYAAVCDLWTQLADRYDLEFVFTDNHSTDGTFGKVRDIAAKDPRVRVVRFNRNYGFQRSLLTGYRIAGGDAAVQLDCDLQDPPSLILDFVALWEQGHDVVVGVRRRRAEPRALTWGRRMFYLLLHHISEDRLTPDAGDFRLVDKSVLDQLRAINDLNPYVRGLTSALAKNEACVPYDRRARQHEQSKFPLRRLVRFAVDGIVGHSIVPLRLASYAGLAISVATCGLSTFYLVAALLFGGAWPSGFATTTLLLLFGISLNAIFLGILGEYVSRIYQQVRQLPLTIVERSINLVERPGGDGRHAGSPRTDSRDSPAMTASRSGRRNLSQSVATE
jgi:polyisoprenyl-phosphate glycosyltransferase